MNKVYEKPSVEFVTLVSAEKITSGDWIPGQEGVGSNNWFG